MFFVCVERSFYWLAWIALTVYALYQFAQASQNQATLYKLDTARDFRDGTLLDNLYDLSDFEWQSFKKLYTNYWYLIFIHFGLSNVFTVYNRPLLKLTAWILVGLFATYTIFSLGALVLVVINVLMLLLLAVLGKNILSYALCFGVILASQTTEISNRIFNSQDARMTQEFDFEEKRHLFVYCLCFLNARGLSSSIDNLKSVNKKELQSSKTQFLDKLVTILAYLLYLPGFFAGPIYLYSNFEEAVRHVRSEPEKEVFLGRKYFESMGKLFILIANILYYEWLLHWLYSSAISLDHTILSDFNNWQLSGFVVSVCLLFYMKYTCIYGTFKVLATFDGLVNVAPPLPQCVAAMHLNSQVWRKFDVGLYLWLRRYIYDPVVNQRYTSILRKFIATLLCFTCIILWHLPLTPTLMIWISLNIINSFLETWARAVTGTSCWVNCKNNLSRPNILRILAVVSLPLFLLSITSNLFFLTSNEKVGQEFLKRIAENFNNYCVYIMLALYCGANVSLDYNKVVPSNTDIAQVHGISLLKTKAKDQCAVTKSKKKK